ncbi:MAG: hypothetical protein WD750_03925 [Gammaproteobacteria bacterium]
MKRTVPRFFTLAVTPLLLALAIPVVHADGYYIHIGDSGYGFKSHSGHRTYGPATSFGHTYGPVTSFGSGHILGGRNQYNLNITRPDHDLRTKHFKSFYDRRNYRKEHRHKKGHGYGYKRGFRDGFRAGQHRNRSLHRRW